MSIHYCDVCDPEDCVDCDTARCPWCDDSGIRPTADVYGNYDGEEPCTCNAGKRIQADWEAADMAAWEWQRANIVAPMPLDDLDAEPF